MAPLSIRALDLFAGHGWGVACQWLGVEELGVEIMPEAVATRTANSMATIYLDVWEGLTERFADPIIAKTYHDWKMAGGSDREFYHLLIASPPCQTFSMAGKGEGRKALDEVLGLIDSKAYRDVALLREFGQRHDPRTALVLTPLTQAFQDLPRYIVLEQVPQVLPVWERMATEMRSWGYSVWVGKLYAEQYGVPQTRIRAVLIAKRDPELDGEALPPTPTHSRYYSHNPAKLDEGVEKWVSMSQALGWGMTERPYPTVASGTESGGGTDPAALGGSGARKTVLGEREAGRWLVSNYSDGGKNGAVKPGSKLPRGRRDDDKPAPTITSKAGSMVWNERHHEWMDDRPSTTIVGEPRLAKPGYRGGRSDYEKGNPIEHRQEGSISLELVEAAALQSYPAEFVWDAPVENKKGQLVPPTKGLQFRQVGNAVPPLLARAIIAAVLA